MKILTLATLKGGAGKTMNAFNIAGILAEKKKVLLFDNDPQCNLSFNCGVNIADTDILTIKDIYSNVPADQPKPEDIIIKAPIEGLPLLDIVPSSIFMFEIEMDLFAKSDRERILEKYFKKYEKDFEYYDYIIMDTNPSMSITNMNAFLISDEIILSTDVSANSRTGAELFCHLWDRKRQELDIKGDNISALIITNLDGRTNISKDFTEFVKSGALQDVLLKTVINTTTKLKETETMHQPINLTNPNHNACKQYRELVKEMKRRKIV